MTHSHRSQNDILIVDDTPENLTVLRRILTEHGYQVRPVLTGELALKTVQRVLPDLILLDIMMPPGMNGYEVCQRLKADERTRDIPVLFISALDETMDKVKAFKVGGVDYITKPFQPEEVLARVETHLALQNMQKRLQEQNIQLQQEISERKQAEETLQQYAVELQEANAELSQYAFVVSHDLKAPLRAIRNYADFLREDLEEILSNNQKAYLDGLNGAVNEANALIRDLLHLSRIDKRNAGIEKIEVGPFLQALIASLDLPDDLEVVMRDDWPTLTVEPVLFRQIFQNLISNAAKFNESSQQRIELGWRQLEEGRYEFFVRDNGIGIDTRHREKIFRIFERLHTKEEFEGTGIGLAIVKKATGKLSGSVRIESKPGEGSTFFVTLPGSQPVKVMS